MKAEDIIIKALRFHEDKLTDGYIFYAGDTEENVDKTLRKIAKDILSRIDNDTRQRDRRMKEAKR